MVLSQLSARKLLISATRPIQKKCYFLKENFSNVNTWNMVFNHINSNVQRKFYVKVAKKIKPDFFFSKIFKTFSIKTFLTFGSGTILSASLIELSDNKQNDIELTPLPLQNDDTSNIEDKKSLWHEFFFKYIIPEMGGLILAVLCAFAAASINIQIPTLLGDLINTLNRQFNEGLNYAEYFALLKDPVQKIATTYLIQGVLTCAYISLLSKVGENVSCQLRINLFNSLLKQDIAFFDERKSGEIIERLTSDVQDFKSSFKLCISQGLKSITQATGCVVSMYSISPKLTLIMAGIIPLLVAIGASMGSLLRKLSHKAQDKTAEATGTASEALSNIRTVRAFAMENIESEKFYDELLQATFLNQLLGFGVGIFQGATNIALNGIVLGMIYSGGYLVAAQEMNPGQLMSFLVASQMIQRSLASISILFGTAVQGSSAANRVFEFIHERPSMNLVGGKKIPYHSLIGDITFNNVSFAYKSRPDSQVLKKFSLRIPHCKVVALCGLSGGGKSTIASLIERFYDPTSGSVSLDGRDLRTLDPSWLRRNVIGYINQEPILFATSIEENIRYGKPEATFEEVEAAAKIANADNFVCGFQDGYQTIVGERGCTLSGGQKQRIAIARALIKNPAILILDEATSALDSDSEKLVQDALSKVMVGRTVLIIAHRLSTIKNADIIAVIGNGQIVEQGSHKELKSQHGIYAELIKQQSMM